MRDQGPMPDDLEKTYGHRVRVRACGILIEDDRLLLVNHQLPGRSEWWAPPGGGVEFGEMLTDALQREFREETGLRINTGPFLFGCEYHSEHLHAIELFFRVMRTGGTLHAGQDPELPLITGVRFMTSHEWTQLAGDHQHGCLKLAGDVEQLQQLKGFYSI